MTRVQALWSQVSELTLIECEELRQLLNEKLDLADHIRSPGDDSYVPELSDEDLTEIRRRIAEYEAGTCESLDAESVLNELRESLRARQS